MKNQKQDISNVQPLHRIRHGGISASIWRFNTEKGPLFNVTFQRAYKDKDKWKYSASFSRKDLLVVSLTAARAFEWITSQSRKPQQQPTDQPANGDDVPF